MRLHLILNLLLNLSELFSDLGAALRVVAVPKHGNPAGKFEDILQLLLLDLDEEQASCSSLLGGYQDASLLA